MEQVMENMIKPPKVARPSPHYRGYVQVTAYLLPEQIKKIESVPGNNLSDKFRHVVGWVMEFVCRNPKPYVKDVKPRGKGKDVTRMTLHPTMIEFVASMGDNHKFTSGARACVELYQPPTFGDLAVAETVKE